MSGLEPTCRVCGGTPRNPGMVPLTPGKNASMIRCMWAMHYPPAGKPPMNNDRTPQGGE